MVSVCQVWPSKHPIKVITLKTGTLLSVVKASSYYAKSKFLSKFNMLYAPFWQIDYGLMGILYLCDKSTCIILNLLPWKQTTTSWHVL